MLQIFNTLTRQKENFTPIHQKKIALYACGVTVYDDCHLGHARTYVAIDAIYRYLQARGYEVNYVRNITDIDDKIIKRANERGEDFSALALFYASRMHEDFLKLNLLPPNHEPRATEYIPAMQALISTLIKKNYAYVASNGDVYFEVRRFSHYGCLSHHDIEQLESGARVEVVAVKRDPLDFVLWKLAKANEPAWDSPWGKGRPGWHIECSAMSMQLLSEHFDIHFGGRDLIFPHHENEIAQSEAASQQKLANIWMHTGFLEIDKEKMSKSLGNFVTIREVLKNHEPEVLRYLLIASHYRSPLIYTEGAFIQARNALERFYTALRFLPLVEALKNSPFEEKFLNAMDDDFNTPLALSILFDLAHHIERLRALARLDTAAAHAALLKKLGAMIGVLQTDPDNFFQSDPSLDTQKITNLIAAREKARREKNWAQADQVRDELARMGVAIEDSINGTTWKKI